MEVLCIFEMGQEFCLLLLSVIKDLLNNHMEVFFVVNFLKKKEFCNALLNYTNV